MHSYQGALAESIYIYHDAIQFTTARGWPLRFMSMGLGLGYNEMILTAHLLKIGHPGAVFIQSFEIEPRLRLNFTAWLTGELTAGVWFETYQTISHLVGAHFGVEAALIRLQLLDYYRSGKLVLADELTEDTPIEHKFSCILYDAFSSKTDPELWSEEHLSKFLAKAALKNCVFATYAATGDLNRALRNSGFLLEDRKGFGFKRESTFAVRTDRSPLGT